MWITYAHIQFTFYINENKKAVLKWHFDVLGFKMGKPSALCCHFTDNKMPNELFQKTCWICGSVSSTWGSFCATGCLHMFGRKTVWGSGCTEGSSGSCGQILYVLPQGAFRKFIVKRYTTCVANLRSFSGQKKPNTFCIDLEAHGKKLVLRLNWGPPLTRRCLCKSSGNLWTWGSGSGLQWILDYMILWRG